MGLSIREESVGRARVLTLSGRLDSETSSDLELAAQDQIAENHRDFVVDLTAVAYVSSAGLRVLLALAKQTDGVGSLRLVGLNPSVKKVFDVAGFTPLFAIAKDRASALRPFESTSATSALDDAAAASAIRKEDRRRLLDAAIQLLEAKAAANAQPVDRNVARHAATLLGAPEPTPDKSTPPTGRMRRDAK